MALPRQQRLSKPNLVQYEKRFRMNEFVIKFCTGENLAAVVVPKKVIPKAVARNKIKRQCLEVIRRAFQQEKIGTVFVRLVNAPEGSVNQSMSQCIQKVREVND